jgi:cation diffusion facilitator family transporter
LKNRRDRKIHIARLSVFSNTSLIIIKIVAGLLSHSVSIISEAIHSGMDLIASIIAFFSVRISSNPPDKKHPYGHGKFENISGVIESILIFIAAIWIIYEAIQRLTDPDAQQVGLHYVGITVMGISAIVNIIVSRILYKVAKETDSVALEADALHLKTDVYTSIGVAAGLALMWITKLKWVDPIVAMLVALLIIYEAVVLLRKAYSPLLDTALPEGEIKIIQESIKKVLAPGMEYHQLRTRKSGNYKYIDMHLEMPPDTSVSYSHKICDDIESEIRSRLQDVEVNIHIEPLEKVKS